MIHRIDKSLYHTGPNDKRYYEISVVTGAHNEEEKNFIYEHCNITDMGISVIEYERCCALPFPTKKKEKK